ncbi:MAG: hypothetical protein IPK17_21685 [Chloroflexi bacterium]|nr:hypothetical protein [Chloroflexota bacterium]
MIDTRRRNVHVACALHIQPSDQFSTYAGWFVDFAHPVYRDHRAGAGRR